ncbi:MAG: phosphopantothenoylcysteine decarboxylase, partial [Pseudomonadota bacterium]|nr:phosphopantothenoylcysteine decarboxylase [Pseudomonadota bacterium]
AVADWRPVDMAAQKMKKSRAGAPGLKLVENPDILASLSKAGPRRPALVVGFAAETENLETYARDKLTRKGCDWIVANNVAPETGVLGGDMNTVHLLSGDGEETWEKMSKTEIAARLTARIGAALQIEKQVPAK